MFLSKLLLDTHIYENKINLCPIMFDNFCIAHINQTTQGRGGIHHPDHPVSEINRSRMHKGNGKVQLGRDQLPCNLQLGVHCQSFQQNCVRSGGTPDSIAESQSYYTPEVFSTSSVTPKCHNTLDELPSFMESG